MQFWICTKIIKSFHNNENTVPKVFDGCHLFGILRVTTSITIVLLYFFRFLLKLNV